MKFKLTANDMFFDIDLWDFISNYNKVNTKIDSVCQTIKTKENLDSCMNKMSSVLKSSVIRINKKKSKNSLGIIKSTGKVVLKNDWFYLIFSTINNSILYTYTVKLVWNLIPTRSWILAWKTYNIEIEDLENETIKSSIIYGMSNPEIKKLGFNFSFKWILIVWVIVSSLLYLVTEAFSYFAG